MRKHRSLLIGLGVGIMLGASMLELINFGQAQGSSVQMLADRQQLEEAAEQQGFALVPAGEELYTRQELDEAVASALAEIAAGTGPVDDPVDGPVDPDDGTALEPPPGGSGEEGEPSVEPSPPAADKVSLYVSYRMTLTEAARGLEELGVIDDANAFIDYARPNSGKLEVGTAVFVVGMSYEEVLAELIRPK